MLRKILLSISIAFAILAAFSVKALAADFATPEQFSDLPSGWSRDAVVSAINNGLLYGVDGKILPKDYLTRAQLAAIVNRAFGTSYAADISQYTDVPLGAWFYDDLSYAVGNRTLVGYNYKLSPSKYATREEVFAVLARAVDVPSTSDLSAIEHFSDYSQVSAWAANDLAAMVENGYMHGASGQLQPKTKITREEFAYVINQFSGQYIGVQQPPIEPEDPVSYPVPDFEYQSGKTAESGENIDEANDGSNFDNTEGSLDKLSVNPDVYSENTESKTSADGISGSVNSSDASASSSTSDNRYTTEDENKFSLPGGETVKGVVVSESNALYIISE